jgi:hypothetical protein
MFLTFYKKLGRLWPSFNATLEVFRSSKYQDVSIFVYFYILSNLEAPFSLEPIVTSINSLLKIASTMNKDKHALIIRKILI